MKDLQKRGLEVQLKHSDDQVDFIAYPFYNWADVIFIFSGTLGGAQTMLGELAEALARMGER